MSSRVCVKSSTITFIEHHRTLKLPLSPTLMSSFVSEMGKEAGGLFFMWVMVRERLPSYSMDDTEAGGLALADTQEWSWSWATCQQCWISYYEFVINYCFHMRLLLVKVMNPYMLFISSPFLSTPLESMLIPNLEPKMYVFLTFDTIMVNITTAF